MDNYQVKCFLIRKKRINTLRQIESNIKMCHKLGIDVPQKLLDLKEEQLDGIKKIEEIENKINAKMN